MQGVAGWSGDVPLALGRGGDSLIRGRRGRWADARAQTGLGVAAGGATTDSCDQRLRRAIHEL